MARIDQFFISTNFEAENQENNPDKSLIRFEFIELLVRVAKAKYLDAGTTSTIADAFEHLLETNILPLREQNEW